MSEITFINEAYADADYINQSDKTYSAMDITAYVMLPNKQAYRLGSLVLLSISTHRDKFTVSSLGRTRIRGYTGGIRTVGGTMSFASLDRSVWWRILQDSKGVNPLPDAMPLFDVTVSFANEYGSLSYTGVTGVTIIDESETYSVDSITIMETYSFMAIDRIPFQPYSSLSPKASRKNILSIDEVDLPDSKTISPIGNLGGSGYGNS